MPDPLSKLRIDIIHDYAYAANRRIEAVREFTIPGVPHTSVGYVLSSDQLPGKYAAAWIGGAYGVKELREQRASLVDGMERQKLVPPHGVIALGIRALTVSREHTAPIYRWFIEEAACLVQ